MTWFYKITNNVCTTPKDSESHNDLESVSVPRSNYEAVLRHKQVQNWLLAIVSEVFA